MIKEWADKGFIPVAWCTLLPVLVLCSSAHGRLPKAEAQASRGTAEVAGGLGGRVVWWYLLVFYGLQHVRSRRYSNLSRLCISWPRGRVPCRST